MGKIVGGFIMSHDPMVFINPKKMDNSHILDAYSSIKARVAELNATSAIIIGADHYILFSPRCLPQLLIGMGEVSGPVDELPGLPNINIPENRELARAIFDYSQESGFDLAVSKTLAVDHSVGVPAQLCLPEGGQVKAVPVYMASGVSPTIRMARAFKFGEMLKQAVEHIETDERVVVMGSGGISHWVGTGEMGKTNRNFDEWVLEMFLAGNADALIQLNDADIQAEAGNGGMEIRHLLAVMGAVPEASSNLILYDAWPGGVTGLGFAERITGL
ncbi:class III extradiol ring-cleavage dioxygenase family protein [Haliea atlantica]